MFDVSQRLDARVNGFTHQLCRAIFFFVPFLFFDDTFHSLQHQAVLIRMRGSDSNGTESNDLRLKVLKLDFNKEFFVWVI
jgi:hypothetical protein